MIINESIDEVTAEYTNNHRIIFRSESERAMLHFRHVTEDFTAWKKIKNCIVPACNKKSIKRSHSLPKEMSLRPISEEGHLLAPQFNQKKGELELQSVGLSDASTFPGFCCEHETLFQSFEEKGNISDVSHLCLQVYRSACHEFYRANHSIKQHDKFMLQFEELRDKRLAELISNRIQSRRSIENLNIKSIQIKKDPLIQFFKPKTEAIRQHALEMKSETLPALERLIFQKDESGIHLFAMSVDLLFPVALSGGSSFYVMDKEVKRAISVLMGVFPSGDRSIIFITGKSAERVHIENYASRWTSDPFRLIAMIETWMVNGTDQWYVTPSVWERLSGTRKEAILTAIMECDQNIDFEYKYSIFDDLRNAMLSRVESGQFSINGSVSDFMEIQRRKMA